MSAYDLTMPIAQGSGALMNNGSGILSFAPTGPLGAVLFSDGLTLDSDSGNFNYAKNPLAASTPVVTNIGAAGAVTYGYKIVARNVQGASLPGSEGITATGNVVLDGTNYNELDWDAVTGAASYDIYLTTAGGNTPTPGFLANTTDISYLHQGMNGSGSPPVTDSTQGFAVTTLTINAATFKLGALTCSVIATVLTCT